MFRISELEGKDINSSDGDNNSVIFAVKANNDDDDDDPWAALDRKYQRLQINNTKATTTETTLIATRQDKQQEQKQKEETNKVISQKKQVTFQDENRVSKQTIKESIRAPIGFKERVVKEAEILLNEKNDVKQQIMHDNASSDPMMGIPNIAFDQLWDEEIHNDQELNSTDVKEEEIIVNLSTADSDIDSDGTDENGEDTGATFNVSHHVVISSQKQIKQQQQQDFLWQSDDEEEEVYIEDDRNDRATITSSQTWRQRLLFRDDNSKNEKKDDDLLLLLLNRFVLANPSWHEHHPHAAKELYDFASWDDTKHAIRSRFGRPLAHIPVHVKLDEMTNSLYNSPPHLSELEQCLVARIYMLHSCHDDKSNKQQGKETMDEHHLQNNHQLVLGLAMVFEIQIHTIKSILRQWCPKWEKVV